MYNRGYPSTPAFGTILSATSERPFFFFSNTWSKWFVTFFHALVACPTPTEASFLMQGILVPATVCSPYGCREKPKGRMKYSHTKAEKLGTPLVFIAQVAILLGSCESTHSKGQSQGLASSGCPPDLRLASSADEVSPLLSAHHTREDAQHVATRNYCV